MTSRDLNNIFLSNTGLSQKFTSKQSGRGKPFPDRMRNEHGLRLKYKLNNAWKQAAEEQSKRLAVSLPTRNGTYIEFISDPGFVLATKSLENSRSGIRLMNVRTEINDDEKDITKATVYVPKGKEHIFLKKVDDYLEKNTEKNKPQNEKLISSISDIRYAVFESFWIGKKEWMPTVKPVWCELWLNADTDDSENETRIALKNIGTKIKNETLRFPERRVLICKANRENLQQLIEASDYIAEIRRATETASFFVDLNNKDQSEWTKDLNKRINVNNTNNIHISILDTGINNGHDLLNDILNDSDCLSYNNDWGTYDHEGHGTSMAGLCAYGDLQAVLESTTTIELGHSLESCKILPPKGENDGRLYGAITIESISNLIINNPDRKRILCMAVTARKFETGDGSPSSWSAAIDELTSGYFDEMKKIIFISAGNVQRGDWNNYPISNKACTVQSPGQSWNAVTVGAYTTRDTLDKEISGISTPLAKNGEISPFSTTSFLWDSKWPIKPEIVLEGGNVLKDEYGCFTCDDLSLLTTFYKPQEKQFETFHATSAATAQAAWIAAKLQAKYPDAWPETIRGLMIHSAKWTEEMKTQFLEGTNKGDYTKLLRVCGYGVPSLDAAIKCMQNSVNLIIESELQPFDKTNGRYTTKDMHIHEIPWPSEILESMFDTPVEMKITLSYFIEPGPGEIGWKDRYRYPSCSLRFDTNGTDTQEMFLKRINNAVQEEYEDVQVSGGGGVNWLIGPTGRNVGSIHSDIWQGTAAQLSMSNLVGVFPAVGWWRERPHLEKWDKKIRYSLIISIATPKLDVDLYTPIVTKIESKIPTIIHV